MKHILVEVREHIAHPLYGDNYYGDWAILPIRQRDKIFRLCQYTESLESVEEKQREELKTKDKELEKLKDELKTAKEILNNTHDINIELMKKLEQYEKENNNGRQNIS